MFSTGEVTPGANAIIRGLWLQLIQAQWGKDHDNQGVQSLSWTV